MKNIDPWDSLERSFSLVFYLIIIIDYLHFLIFLSIFQVRPKNSQLSPKSLNSDASSVSLIPKREKSSEKYYLDLNNKCLESILIPDNDVNSFTEVEIKTESQIENENLDDNIGVNSFSVIKMKTEDVNTLSDDDVSTKVGSSDLKNLKR